MKQIPWGGILLNRMKKYTIRPVYIDMNNKEVDSFTIIGGNWRWSSPSYKTFYQEHVATIRTKNNNIRFIAKFEYNSEAYYQGFSRVKFFLLKDNKLKRINVVNRKSISILLYKFTTTCKIKETFYIKDTIKIIKSIEKGKGFNKEDLEI